MMPIINIHPLPSEEKAESFRLSLKDADKFGLYCMYDGSNAMWSVIPKIALDLIFNAETTLPVTKRKWVGLTNDELTDLFYNTNLGQQSAVGQAIELLRERNT